MFKRLHVDNYKCLVNFDLAFQDLTLLLGRNGTGKTSVLDIICSHHPELIDYLGLSSGISLSREPSGVTRATRIDALSLTTEGGLKLSEIVARGWDR